MVSCSMHGCSHRSSRPNKKSQAPVSSVSYHRFPRDEKLRQKWIIATGKKNFNPAYRAWVCGDHFDESCFSTTSSGKRSWLKPGSIPVSSAHEEKQSRRGAKERKARKLRAYKSTDEQAVKPEIVCVSMPCQSHGGGGDGLEGSTETKKLGLGHRSRQNCRVSLCRLDLTDRQTDQTKLLRTDSKVRPATGSVPFASTRVFGDGPANANNGNHRVNDGENCFNSSNGKSLGPSKDALVRAIKEDHAYAITLSPRMMKMKMERELERNNSTMTTKLNRQKRIFEKKQRQEKVLFKRKLQEVIEGESKRKLEDRERLKDFFKKKHKEQLNKLRKKVRQEQRNVRRLKARVETKCAVIDKLKSKGTNRDILESTTDGVPMNVSKRIARSSEAKIALPETYLLEKRECWKCGKTEPNEKERCLSPAPFFILLALVTSMTLMYSASRSRRWPLHARSNMIRRRLTNLESWPVDN